jgi:hypothetical protein
MQRGMRSFNTLLLLGLLVAPLGCADATGLTPEEMGEEPAGPAPGPKDDGTRALAIAGERDVFLAEGASTTLRVRYVNGQGRPVAGRVAFAAGDAAASAGATVDASATTDATGTATATLRAGRASAFIVTASADGAAAVSFRVSVTSAQAPERPLTFAGSYTVQSRLDLGGNLPGMLGAGLRTLGDLTDGPNDPATFLVDVVLTKIDSPTLTSLVGGFRPGLDAGLNGFLIDLAPAFVDTLRSVGQDLTSVTRRFGLESQLVIAEETNPDGATGALTMRHTLKKLVFELDGMRAEFPMAQLDLGEPAADRITGTAAADGITVGAHELSMSYGHIVLFVLKNVVIPRLVPGASDPAGVLRHFIHCDGVAGWIVDHIGLGSVATFEGACAGAIDAVGGVIEGEILVLDQSAARLTLAGTAKPLDRNGDRTIDALDAGAWSGTFVLAGQTAPLLGAPANVFTGARVETPVP